jgi:hypothetical protein
MASFTELHISDLLVFQASKKKIRAEKWFFPFVDSKVTLYICGVSPGFDRVARVIGRPAGSTGFHQFFLLVFCLTRAGSATRSTRFRVNLSGRSGFNNTASNSTSLSGDNHANWKRKVVIQVDDSSSPQNQAHELRKHHMIFKNDSIAWVWCLSSLILRKIYMRCK